MSWRAVLIWWGLAVALIALLLTWERVRPASGAGAERTPQAVFADPATGRPGIDDLPATWIDAAPAAVFIDREGDPRLAFERDPAGVWQQVAPVSYPMDAFSIERTLDLARSMRARDVLDPGDMDADDGATPALLGFEPPRAVMTVMWPATSDAAAETVTIELGRRGIGGRAYARVRGDDRILVIDAELHERAVTMDPREWRDRSIFGDVSVDTAASITMNVGQLRTELERDGRRWRMAAPFSTRVNGTLLDDLIGRLATASVGGFVLDAPDDLARFGLAPQAEADVRVRIAAPGRPERTVRLRIGATAGAATQDRYGLIDDRPVVVRVPGSLVQAIARRPAEWAEPTASGVRSVDVGSMRLLRSDPALEVVLERDGAAWTMAVGRDGATPGAANPVDAAAPSRLLDLLSEVRAPSVRAGQLPAEASTTVVLEDFSGLPVHTVRIAAAGTQAPGEDGATGINWVMDAGDGLLRLYPGSIQPPLTPEAFDPPAPGTD